MVSVEVTVEGALLGLGEVESQAALGTRARLCALLPRLPSRDDDRPHAERPLGAPAHPVSQAVGLDRPICSREWECTRCIVVLLFFTIH